MAPRVTELFVVSFGMPTGQRKSAVMKNCGDRRLMNMEHVMIAFIINEGNPW
jgi:hypothetical protein